MERKDGGIGGMWGHPKEVPSHGTVAGPPGAVAGKPGTDAAAGMGRLSPRCCSCPSCPLLSPRCHPFPGPQGVRGTKAVSLGLCDGSSP